MCFSHFILHSLIVHQNLLGKKFLPLSIRTTSRYTYRAHQSVLSTSSRKSSAIHSSCIRCFHTNFVDRPHTTVGILQEVQSYIRRSEGEMIVVPAFLGYANRNRSANTNKTNYLTTQLLPSRDISAVLLYFLLRKIQLFLWL